MRLFIITLLCSCMALCTLAETPRLTRSQLKQATIINDRQAKSPANEVKQTKPLSLQRVLKERNLSLNDNRINAQSLTAVFPGNKIASVDSYDFDWDSANAIAIVNDTTCAMLGKNCSLQVTIGNQLYISDLYGSFKIPLSIESGTVTIRAGVKLDSIIGSSNPRGYSFLYAMPLSWLAGDSVYHDIHGVVCDDGTIEFTDDFGFLVEQCAISGTDSSSWGLSPILANLVLYQPNATHYFQSGMNVNPYTATVVYVNFLNEYFPNGSGGTVPRPINPRPSNSSSIANTGSNKPITPPRRFQQTSGRAGLGKTIADGTSLTTNNSGFQGKSFSLDTISRMHDVYMYQLDDTTIMVYNLYGSDYCWNYMKVNPSGAVFIPSQPMATNSTGDVLVNCSGSSAEADTLMWGNQGMCLYNQITWDDTYLCCENQSDGTYSIKKSYVNNVIVLNNSTLDIPDWPCPTPDNLTALPMATSARVTWNDSIGTQWNLRYRPYVDETCNPIDCNLNGEVYEVLETVKSTWEIVDADADGHTWSISSVGQDNYCFQSDSWTSSLGGLNPDNWLISNDVKLQGELRFTVWGNSDAYSENLMAYAIIGDEAYPLFDEDIHSTATPETFTVNLSPFEEEIGRIAFRHYNTIDQFSVFLDDIFIGDPNADVVDPAEWISINGLDDADFTIDGLIPESSYQAQVRAVNAGYPISDWTESIVFFTLPDTRGDVNRDERVSIGDVTALINYMLSGDDTGINLDAADCNRDGEVKIGDVTAIISFLLLGAW